MAVSPAHWERERKPHIARTQKEREGKTPQFSEQVKVHYSVKFAIQMFDIQIPTVLTFKYLVVY